MTRLQRAAPAQAFILAAALLLAPARAAQAQEGTVPPEGPAATMDDAAAAAERDLQESLRELSALRDSIAAGKLPLARELSRLEGRLVQVRAELQSLSRDLDSRNLDLGNLQTEIKARDEEGAYLVNLLEEYTRNFESRLHISELQRYGQLLERARRAAENRDMGPAEASRARLAVVQESLGRLDDRLGGTTFDGRAVGPDGSVHQVRFALVGPLAVCSDSAGRVSGLAEQRLGSLEPNVVPLNQRPELAAQIANVVATGIGILPFDPSQGDALKIERTKEGLVEHIANGGPVMVPILLLAAAALLVAVVKWIQILRIPKTSPRKVEGLLDSLSRRDYGGVAEKVAAIPGPTGAMLRAGLDHLSEPKDLVEEVMFERMLETRLKLQSFLSFIALSASAAPLLGLLGTVTGMINTFKLITVFGSGDPRTLSGGISEALITTEYGLIVAIPALLLYAYLSRRTRRMIDAMEKTAVSFLNRMPAALAPPRPAEAGAEWR